MKTAAWFALLFFLFSLQISLSQINWQQTNGPYGGDVYSFAVSGTNLFAGTDNGVFLSTNSGMSWTAANAGLMNKKITELVISDTNIFAGTYGGSGVFLSTNNGTSWTAINTGLTNNYIGAFAVRGKNIFVGDGSNGVFLSTNNGTNWSAVNTGLTNTSIQALVASDSNLFAGTFGGGVFLSTNNGSSWTTVNTGLTNTSVRVLTLNGTNLYAGTDGDGVFLSTNNGKSWTHVFRSPTYLTDVRAIATSPASGGTSGTNLFVGTGTEGIFLSTNNGTSWINTGMTAPNVWSLAVSGTNLFAGTAAGIFLSTNNGISWILANRGIINTTIYSLAAIPSASGSDSSLFAGTNNGVFRSTDNGTSWTAANTGMTNNIIWSLAVSGKNLFAASFNNGVFLSTNNGMSWREINTGMTSANVQAFAVSGTNLFAGTIGGGVFLSTNNGTNWTAVNSGLTKTTVWSLAVSGTNLFAGVNGGAFRSTNNGTSWTAISDLTVNDVVAFTVSGTNLFAGTNGGAFRSTDNGTSWTEVNTGLTNTRIRSLAVFGKNLFAGTRSDGVFLSTNNGTSWNKISTNLTCTNVSALAVSSTKLFAGTDGGGVFVGTLSQSPPSIISCSPTRNALNVPKNTNITITFDQDINQSTLTNSTIKINASMSGSHTGTYTYNSSTKILTVTPTIPFNVGELVTVTLTSGIKSVNGDLLSGGYTWCFTMKTSTCSGLFSQSSWTGVGNTPWGAVAVDFDKDGAIDLAVVNNQGNSVSILKNDGSGSFTLASTVAVGNNPASITVVDMDGDGYMDLLVANSGSGTVSLLRNNGNGSFTRSDILCNGIQPWNVAALDIDGDGNLDLAVASFSSNSVSILKNKGGGSFVNLSSVNVGQNPYTLAVLDLDGDGVMDLAVANYTSNSISLLKNNGSGVFTQISAVAVGNGPVCVLPVNIDADSSVDLVVSNNKGNSISILKNNGTGMFSLVSTSTIVTTAFPAATDIDGDGSIDLIVPGIESIAVLKNNGAGVLAAKSVFNMNKGSIIRMAVAADFNNDGQVDFAGVDQITNSILIFKSSLNNLLSPSAPQYLFATAGNGQVTLQWNKNTETDFTRYRIYRGTSPNSTTKVDSTTGGITDTTKIITGLINGTTYFFRVTAVNNSGLESAYSNEVSITGIQKLVFNAVSPITKTALDTVKFVVNAAGANVGDVVTYSVIGLPNGAKFDTTRTFFWIPTVSQYGSYKVSFIVSDGQRKDSMAVSISISIVNLKVKKPIADMTLTDETRIVKVKLTLPPVFVNNVGVLTYTATSGNTAFVTASIIVPDTLRVQGLRPTPQNASIRVTVTATDTNQSTISTSFFVIDQGTTGVVDMTAIPKEFSLSQNFPNPFNPSTIIGFNIPARSFVILRVFDVMGREVATLVNQEKPAGTYHVTFDAESLPSGTYFYRLQTGTFTETKKLLLMR